MRSIAIYSLKGGVGKTSLAVNLARAAATLSARKTLLWDLDGQAAASFLLGVDDRGSTEAEALFSGDLPASRLIRATATPRLDLLPADKSLRRLDKVFFDIGKKKRLEKLLERIGKGYDRVILDCPPGFAETSEQVLRSADLIIVPVIPSPLSQRAFGEVADYLDGHSIRSGAILPVFNMVDRRRSLHRQALAENPKWPVVPMASAIESLSARRTQADGLPPSSAAANALAALWKAVEKRLSHLKGG
ncbi:ParA family protein [Sphingosinicella rhizophila]|uniref:ParA family protein n=1 Tax=Sphingosinicella rhizophila TaxID=3050082 RepID=A0ABU3Q4M7_9SPHN|nr:ParA family protein [Sphingosinicella sp. GR2756]MDT9598373.1 ParA family protein [Sphingosinicella sp. GR2756]